MRPTVLLIFGDSVHREVLGAAMRHSGLDAIAVDHLGAAVDRLTERDRPAPRAIGVESAVLRDEAALWTRAIRGDVRFADLPVVVDARRAPESAAFPKEYTVVPPRAGVLVLASALASAARSAAVRVAKGTERVDAVLASADLHEYARSKLAVYLGASRAATLLGQVAADLPGQRIATTNDLREIAGRLRTLGALEATVAALLSGRATLLDSEETLRSSRRTLGLGDR